MPVVAQLACGLIEVDPKTVRREPLPADWAPNRTRPLCPYPQLARFLPGGNAEHTASFVCR